MVEFALKNNLFEFNNVFQQISGTAVGTKFAPPYAWIYMDRVGQDFLEKQELQSLLWLRYIDYIYIFFLDSWKGRIKKVYGEV